jgi:DNA replicative helicase MCM subunit Mcm2 (Cdc46/Mcm family)
VTLFDIVSIVTKNNLATVYEKTKRKDEISCIQLSKDTKEKLDELGTRKDTYESIIKSLIASTNSCANKQGENQEENSDD